jgi:hypothetical protein
LLLLYGKACFLLQYDRRLVMPWLVNNAVMCGLLFLIVIGGAITWVILTASQLKDDLTTVSYGFVILVPGALAIGNKYGRCSETSLVLS